MAFQVCDECKACWNYYVDSSGCVGSNMPCGSYVTDDEFDYGDNDNDDENECDDEEDDWDI